MQISQIPKKNLTILYKIHCVAHWAEVEGGW